MHVYIASTRAPKVNGVRRAFEHMSKYFSINRGEIVFISKSVESGVPSTPRSIEELISGSRTRAASVFAEEHNGDVLAVGVEGGLFQVETSVFLQSWCCIYNGLDFSFGSSGSIELPQDLAATVMHTGTDLGEAIDMFAGQHDVRSRQGTWGILTDDVITREDSFELATLNALFPMVNKKLYGHPGRSK